MLDAGVQFAHRLLFNTLRRNIIVLYSVAVIFRFRTIINCLALRHFQTSAECRLPMSPPPVPSQDHVGSPATGTTTEQYHTTTGTTGPRDFSKSSSFALRPSTGDLVTLRVRITTKFSYQRAPPRPHRPRRPERHDRVLKRNINGRLCGYTLHVTRKYFLLGPIGKPIFIHFIVLQFSIIFCAVTDPFLHILSSTFLFCFRPFSFDFLSRRFRVPPQLEIHSFQNVSVRLHGRPQERRDNGRADYQWTGPTMDEKKRRGRIGVFIFFPSRSCVVLNMSTTHMYTICLLVSSTSSSRNKVSSSSSFNSNMKISKESIDLRKTPSKTPKKSKSPGW